MKFFHALFVLGVVILITEPSCKKQFSIVTPVPISALTVVNAVVFSNPLISDFSGADSIGAYYFTTPQVEYGSFNEYSIPSGNIPAVIYQFTDTLHPLFNGQIKLEPHTIYSLFLAGVLNGQNRPDTMLTVDLPPYHAISDSTVGVRFVNLSSGSNPVSVNIQGNAYGSEVSSLLYKGITVFKNYPATSNITQYTFEIRDAGSDSLLTSYTYNLLPFQNITIAVIGSEDLTVGVPISAMQANNY